MFFVGKKFLQVPTTYSTKEILKNATLKKIGCGAFLLQKNYPPT